MMLVAALGLAVPIQSQQTITLRILDYKSAKPLKGLHVDIECFDGSLSPGRKATILMRKSIPTDKDGSAVVNIPEPLPEHMRVYSDDLWDATADFSPAEVLRSGAVDQYEHATEEGKRNVPPAPGRIVVFAKRFTFWNRVLQEVP